MALPFFYFPEYNASQQQMPLNEETSKHIVQVLRMKEGEQINLTDGKGNLLTCVIVSASKKHCEVRIEGTRYKGQGTRKVSVAISLLKNANRFEWFLEKATEIGVNEIIPLICERTEREKFRFDRMQGIVISAMLQSQQVWLPVLHEPQEFGNMEVWIPKTFGSENAQAFIAHCIENDKQALANFPISSQSPAGQFPNLQILIGPEGDFTPREIELALQHQFIPVSLGETRLRTETAGVVAATILCLSKL